MLAESVSIFLPLPGQHLLIGVPAMDMPLPAAGILLFALQFGA